MKKIVALVLCLALALSLCTVAFAAQVKVDNVGPYTSDDVKAEAPVYKNDKIKEEGVLAHYVINNNYYVAADTSADITLYFTASKKEERVEQVNVYDVYYQYVGTKITDINNDTCGSMIDDTEEVTFVVYEDETGATVLAQKTTLTSMTDTRVLVNGEVIAVTGGVEYTAHAWELVDADDDGKVDSKEIVKCSECGATSKIYTVGSIDATPAPIDGTLFENLRGAEFSANANTASKYWAAATYGWMTGAASGSTSDTVESAKTFDAGIALYAGMALASVAGSAVVIGKKKEF